MWRRPSRFLTRDNCRDRTIRMTKHSPLVSKIWANVLILYFCPLYLFAFAHFQPLSRSLPWWRESSLVARRVREEFWAPATRIIRGWISFSRPTTAIKSPTSITLMVTINWSMKTIMFVHFSYIPYANIRPLHRAATYPLIVYTFHAESLESKGCLHRYLRRLFFYLIWHCSDIFSRAIPKKSSYSNCPTISPHCLINYKFYSTRILNDAISDWTTHWFEQRRTAVWKPMNFLLLQMLMSSNVLRTVFFIVDYWVAHLPSHMLHIHIILDRLPYKKCQRIIYDLNMTISNLLVDTSLYVFIVLLC